jgi:methionine-S-sulfoxide reductase
MRARFVALVILSAGLLGWPTDSLAETRSDSASQSATDVENTRTAVFAGGCFWCTELVFRQLKGVVNVESGYCGGTKTTAAYEKVHHGTTNHAEAVRVTYNPKKINYDQLLDVFFDAHDPTQWNRQGEEDVGRQYRSAIFFANDEQKNEAEMKIRQLQQKRVYRRRIVTRLEPLEAYYPAEELHQGFALKFPGLPYVQDHAIPKACNVRIKHPELIESQR